jgi:hypothetical protein
VVATTGRGLEDLKKALEGIARAAPPAIPESWPELSRTADQLTREAGGALQRVDVIQALIHPESRRAGILEKHLGGAALQALRVGLFGDEPPQADEARHRYRWVRDVLGEAQRQRRCSSASARALQGSTGRGGDLMFFAVCAGLPGGVLGRRR